MSAHTSTAFELLDRQVQRWIWEHDWRELRDIQERAIPLLLEGETDLIIAAATASGKTEAAFFPILSRLKQPEHSRALVVYVSPLKALINDQWPRLLDLCREMEIPVTGWHGDVSAHQKARFLEDPRGILLITPESLEAHFVSRGDTLDKTFSNLRYLVVDEMHAFLGTERGMQLQSLLARVDQISGRASPRVGLSATLGDMELAKVFLRPRNPSGVALIESAASVQGLEVLVRGFVDSPLKQDEVPEQGEGGSPEPASTWDIASQVFRTMRGSHNLVFPNTRRNVEIYADRLRLACEHEHITNEFWPHHGSLSKNLREEAERALKATDKPATVICTTTLELGIDVGAVKSVGQIGAPPGVASLRQRLGRSGRRPGESAILWGFCPEVAIHPASDVSDLLREGLVQTIAAVQLLVKDWCEPPRPRGLHASTFVQQILSVIAQRNGATPETIWKVLVHDGAFSNISRADYHAILQQLADLEIIFQSESGLLLFCRKGESLVGHYSFYAAFATEDEYRLVTVSNRQLGTLPVARPVIEGQGLVFSGQRWRVVEVNIEKRVIRVTADAGGAPPMFEGSGAMIHDGVRFEMREVLRGKGALPWLDRTAKGLLAEARRYYREMDLDNEWCLETGDDVVIFTWRGDWVNDALVLLLQRQRLRVANQGLALQVTDATPDEVQAAFEAILMEEALALPELLSRVRNLNVEKWDWALPPDVKLRAYASLKLDVPGALQLVRKFVAG
jgi:ATP-dependent Lhr-like helicase